MTSDSRDTIVMTPDELKELERLEDEIAEIQAKEPKICYYCDKFADKRCWHCEELVCYEHQSKQAPGNEIYDDETGDRSVCCYKCVKEIHNSIDEKKESLR